MFVVGIAVGVLWYLALIPTAKPGHRRLLEAQRVECGWTVLPCVVLVAIALPSLRLLYMLDEAGRPRLTLKTVGHQWY